MNIFLTEKQADFEDITDFFKRDIATLRTGRANPAVLDGIQVEAYGVMNPLNAVANIAVADARNAPLLFRQKSRGRSQHVPAPPQGHGYERMAQDAAGP